MEMAMPRKPRFTLPGIPQHVIQRGNNREPCFFTIEDYRFYLGALQAACHKSCCSVHAYVLMTNHVHLLVTPGAVDSISVMMQSLGRNQREPKGTDLLGNQREPKGTDLLGRNFK